MADGRTEEARVAPAAGRPTTGYASAPSVEDEQDTRRSGGGGQPSGPLPETAARFAAAMAAVERQQAPSSGGDRPPAVTFPGPQPAMVQAPRREQQRSAAPTGSGVRRPRRARLRLTHVDPWSVMKTSLLLSIALGIVTVVAVSVIWAVLNASGLWDSINRTVGEVVGSEQGGGFRIQDYVGTERVLGFTMLVAAVDVVLITVVATLGAFLYNLAAALLGGLEVVLAEDEF